MDKCDWLIYYFLNKVKILNTKINVQDWRLVYQNEYFNYLRGYLREIFESDESNFIGCLKCNIT